MASATQANHQYTYADADLAGSECSRGYRQAMIVITPQVAGNAFTVVNLGAKHSQSNLGTYVNPWLDIQFNAPSVTTIQVRGTLEARVLERLNVTAIGNVTSLSSAFQSCASLQSVLFPAGSLTALSDLSSTFSGCSSLRSVSFPSSFSAGSSALTSSAFSGCASLANIDNCKIANTFTVAGCALSAAALDEIYTALPTVTGKTITVSTNWGTTGDTPAIATAKGWTVTGS